MLEEDLPKQAMEKGQYLLKQLRQLQEKFPDIILNVQGKGLLVGMEFPSNEIGYKVVSGIFGRFVITAGTLINAEAVRIEPALNVPYPILDEALNRLEDTLKSIS
jgi:putrescine aminotransferase